MIGEAKRSPVRSTAEYKVLISLLEQTSPATSYGGYPSNEKLSATMYLRVRACDEVYCNR